MYSKRGWILNKFPACSWNRKETDLVDTKSHTMALMLWGKIAFGQKAAIDKLLPQTHKELDQKAFTQMQL